jgi:hypothetical protein
MKTVWVADNAGLRFVLVAAFVCALLACRHTPGEAQQPGRARKIEAPAAGINCLVAAYPDWLARAEGNEIVWRDGTRMTYDDGQTKPDWETTLNRASLKDQMAQCYPPGRSAPPAVDYDPGRARYEPFFFKMYGASPDQVRRKLVPVVWLPKRLNRTLLVTSVNRINDRLQAVSNELDKLPDEFVKYLENPGGTFNWRNIAGTSRQSTHSFGATIDINVRLSDYWRNDKPDAQGRYAYQNRIPREIVEIFERHGFIWGGQWYHYDTMHFEYRPELLADGCACQH